MRSSRAAIVLATHDQRLAESLRGPVWGIEDGALRRYGDVGRYLAGKPSRATLGTADGLLSTRSDREAGTRLPIDTAPSPEATFRDRDATYGSGDADAFATSYRARASMLLGASGALSLHALEDERQLIEEVLMDPFRPSQRERERLAARRSELDDALGEAYEARMSPPSPRFHVRENGLSVVADRTSDGLIVLLPCPNLDGLRVAAQDRKTNPCVVAARAATAAVMAALLLAVGDADLATTEGAGTDSVSAEALDEHGLSVPVKGTLPWIRVSLKAGVAHLALFEPEGRCLLPYARTALVEAAARFAFTLMSATALQLFCTEPLPGTRLLAAGGGWLTWNRNAFEHAEGWRERGSEASSRRRRRRRAEPRGPQ